MNYLDFYVCMYVSMGMVIAFVELDKKGRDESIKRMLPSNPKMYLVILAVIIIIFWPLIAIRRIVGMI